MFCISTCLFSLGRIQGKIVFLSWHRLQWQKQLLLDLKSIASELQHLNWKELLCGLLEILALSIAILNPQRYKYQRDMNWKQWHHILRVRLSLLGAILQELIAQGDYESTLIEGRKKNAPCCISSSLWASPLFSMCNKKTINSVLLSGDILSKIYKGHERIWFISPYLFS